MKPNTLPTCLPELLEGWYEEHKRSLPWRQDRQPYHIWVSEIMLQQTRVEAVKGYYTRFLQRLPDIEALACCDDQQLHKLWEGLGYYSRVRNLKKAAQTIVDDYGGSFPKTHAEILALPGIGPYTAGAICSIAYDLPTPAVDGNVLRLVSRLWNDEAPIDTPAMKSRVTEALAAIYPQKAGLFTQALMELGATVCGPDRLPDCDFCPCKDICLGHGQGHPERLPKKSPKREKRLEEKTVFILECQDRYALGRREDKSLLAGLWEFPNVEGSLSPQQALEQLEAWNLQPRDLEKIINRKHVFTHIIWQMQGVYARVEYPWEEFTWMTPEEIEEQAALPTAFRLFWEECDHV